MTRSQLASSFTVPPAKTDIRLLEAARKMDKAALIEIFDRYSIELYNFALRSCHNHSAADNIVGDVFAKFLDQLANGGGAGTNLRSYLYQLAYREIINGTRVPLYKLPLEDLELVPGEGSKAPAGLEDPTLLDTALRAINNEFTEDQRYVIILRFLERFSLRETAKILGKKVNTIKALQNRGITKLRKALGSVAS